MEWHFDALGTHFSILYDQKCGKYLRALRQEAKVP
jgi:hypothetical protein